MGKCIVGRIAAVGIAGAFMAFDCLAETQYLPVGETANVDVAADATLPDSVSLADRTAIVKGGAGKLTVPSGKFIQDKTVNLRVREGGVKLTATQQELDAYPQPTETMNKAAFWLESRTNLVKEGDDIKEWRDVRDTDSSETNHYYAVTDNTWTDLCPQEATYNEKSAVYFRGYQSGCWMNWQKPVGGQATVGNLYHVFLVHGAASNWGFALGQRNGQSPYFQPGEPGGGANAVMWIGHNFENKPMHCSRTYRDGVEVDAFLTPQGSGIHVVEVDCLEMRQSAQCFFNDRDFWNDGSGHNPMFGPESTTRTEGGKRSGGEYICEMLLFTNRLSEAERVGVSNWLLRKWRDVVPPQNTAVAVALATNTVLEVENGAYSSLSVSGDGTLANAGQDMLVMPSLPQPKPRTVQLRTSATPITLGHLMTVECAAGDTVNSAITYAGPQLTTASTAGEGRLVKTGNGPLLLDKIPEGVQDIVVSGGLLMLSDPDRHADLVPGPDMNVAATIPEWSFETYDAASAGSFKYFNNSEHEGWHGIKPNDSYSQVFIFDTQYGKPQGWEFTLNPPDGKNCLVLKNHASAWREFAVPETGKYELEFWAAPRNGYAGTHLEVMIGTSESDLVSFGDIRTYDIQGWRRYVYQIGLLEAGSTYQLWFRTKGESSSANDRCTQIDAVRIKLPEAVIGTWAIPNGDFEDHAINFSNSFTLDNTNRVTGFTVGQYTGTTVSGESTSDYYTTFSVHGTDDFAHYNRPWSTGGKTQFYMTGTGSKLVTTFTPPAGRWHVQADMSAWSTRTTTAGKAYAVDAEVTIGGVTTALGQISTSEHRLAPRKWPNAFVVDGETPVTLTLTGVVPNSWGHGILDNLVLVAACAFDENLLADPGIDDQSKWSFAKTLKPSGVTGSQFMYCDSFYRQHFGIDTLTGDKVVKIVNDDAFYQSVTFPTGGLYRLTVNLKTRGASAPSSGAGNNPVDVYLAKDGVTNIVGRSDNAATTNYNEYAFTFAIPEAGGTYDVGFHGTSVWGGGSTTVDRTMLLDAAWLCRVETESETSFSKDLRIEVADGARLQLDFAGTNEVAMLRIAGRGYKGLVSAATHPELFPALCGPGTLFVVPKGMLIIVR